MTKEMKEEKANKRVTLFEKLPELHHVVHQTSATCQSHSLHRVLLLGRETTHHGILVLRGQMDLHYGMK